MVEAPAQSRNPTPRKAGTQEPGTRVQGGPSNATLTAQVASKQSGAQAGITGSNMIVSPSTEKWNVTSGNSLETTKVASSVRRYRPSSTWLPSWSRDPKRPSAEKKWECRTGIARRGAADS